MLAQALAPNVRVCGVAPGLVLGSELIGADQLLRLQSATPLQTGATPEDVAAAVLFMLNSKTITGSTVIIDAGSHLRATNRDFAFQ
jgi:NAD(P)-dependent dehydrogenase (short-subunit alcohol dehydrogenase family)